MSIYWVVLFIACIVEIAWAISLKLIQEQFSIWLVVVAGILTVVNMGMLSFAMRGIPVGTAYAIWTGLGAVGVATLGVVFFGDPLTAPRIAFLAVIITGIIGLKLVS